MLDIGDLNPDQRAALAAIAHWHRYELPRGKRVFRLFGYAGTGKTSLARVVAAHVIGDLTDVIFVAFTNKAAKILADKGCVAQTIHSLIYKRNGFGPSGGINTEKIIPVRQIVEKKPARVRDQKPEFDLDWKNKQKWKLLVIDECSMVDYPTGHDLLRLGIPILALGDPAQLPPINEGGSERLGFFMKGDNDRGDFCLEMIVRQREGDPIIQLATRARQQRPPLIGHHSFRDPDQ